MRTTKELLELLKTEIENYNILRFTGMCGCIFDMYNNRECISKDEYHYLKNYLRNNVHKNISIGEYWWPVGDKQIRLAWIDRQLKKLQDGE